MRKEISLLLKGLGDKIDPQISAFLLNGLETGAFDYSIYTEVYDVKIVINKGNEGELQKLIDKFKLITTADVYRVIERCLSLDLEPMDQGEVVHGAPGVINKFKRFWNSPPKVDPIHLGPFGNKRLLDYGPTIDRITDGIVANSRPAFSRLEAFILAWMVTDTFLHTAENKTRLDNFKSAGRVEQKCWITQRDEKVRREHQAAERQQGGLYEPFIIANENLEYPGDPDGSFENILLCRCYMVPIS